MQLCFQNSLLRFPHFLQDVKQFVFTFSIFCFPLNYSCSLSGTVFARLPFSRKKGQPKPAARNLRK